MKVIVITLLLATSLSAADLGLGVGGSVGYLNWNGWTGTLLDAEVGPRLRFGSAGLGVAALYSYHHVAKGDTFLRFAQTGGLLTVSFAPGFRFVGLDGGLGYGYIPGFTGGDGTAYPGLWSPLFRAGMVFPFLGFSLGLGIESNFALESYYGLRFSARYLIPLRGPSRSPRHREKPAQPGPEVASRPSSLPPEPSDPGSRPAFPPRLETELAFEETGRLNHALDAGEQAYILATVQNAGKGKADGVRVRVEAISSVSGVSIGQDIVLPEILPGASRQAKVRLAAGEDVPDQEVRFRVSVVEPVFGADALPAVISITTRALEPPDLRVHDYAMTDDENESQYVQGNGNGRLEVNEQVEVTVIVQNKGTGMAQGVSATVTPTDANVLYQSPRERVSLGDVPPGEWRELKFPIFVNARYRGDTVKLLLDLAEERPRFSRAETVRIPMNAEMAKPSEVVVAPKRVPGTGRGVTPPSLTDSLLVDIPKGKQNPDAIAVVIGVSNYRQVARVEYAARDADAVQRYLVEAFGYLDGNVITLNDPSKGDLERVFGTAANPDGQLYNLVSAKPNQQEVFIYYVGHGAPSIREKRGYLVPADASPDYIEINGYPLDLFYSNLARIPASKTTVVIDACFSGETPDIVGQVSSFLRDASPVPVVAVTNEMPGDAVVMTAATGSQIASWYPDKRHSLFTYYLLKGLKGEADRNRDGTIVLKELDEYVADHVPRLARVLYAREQTPTFSGDETKVIVRLK